MDPLVATGMVEVPVGVDQLLDGIGVDACDGLLDVWTGGDDFGINQQLSVRAGENRDISTSAQKDADVAAKVLNRDFRCGGFLERSSNDASCLGDQVTWSETSCGDCQTSGSEKLTA